jgi:hypothetical protein
MDLQHIEVLMRQAARVDAAWWKDDRRFWCAYCGIPTRRKPKPGAQQPDTLGTRDHVIPKAHQGGMVTIPACRSCNVAKGAKSLQEFLLSDYFQHSRKNKHRNQWPLHLLWAVAGVAALKRSAKLFELSSSTISSAQSGPTANRTR